MNESKNKLALGGRAEVVEWNPRVGLLSIAGYKGRGQNKGGVRFSASDKI